MTGRVPQRYDRLVRRLAIAAVLVGSVARADPQTADRAADEAAALAKQGQFGTAAQKFREAYRADPRPDLMCNVGVAYYKAQDLPRAQRYLEQCVQIGAAVDKAFIEAVKQALASLDASLHAGDFTPVSFLIEPNQASIAAVGNEPFDEPILGSRVVWFPRGAFSVVIHAEGYVDQTIAVEARSRDPITKPVTLVRAPVVVQTHEPPPTTPTPPYVPLRQPPRPRPYAKPIAATVLAGVAGASALAFFGFARIRANDANTASDANQQMAYDDAAHAARTWQAFAIGTAAVAAVSAGAAIYFWLHATRHVDIEPTGGGAALSFSGRF